MPLGHFDVAQCEAVPSVLAPLIDVVAAAPADVAALIDVASADAPVVVAAAAAAAALIVAGSMGSFFDLPLGSASHSSVAVAAAVVTKKGTQALWKSS